MFPIRNVSGATVGYSGRIMPQFVDPSISQGKYVNTPETELYHKSKILFGYDTAKKAMHESKSVVVVEGQMDLCMSYQAGIHNTVAVSGTAFTDEHINLIKRFCDTVILSFDRDPAGQAALKKTALLCLLGGLDVYAVSDIGTKDPADLIAENPEAWREAVVKKEHVVEVMLSQVLDLESDSRAQGRKIVSDVLPFVRAIQSPVDRAHFVRVISERSGIPQATLLEELSRGFVEARESAVPEKAAVMHSKDRLMREIIAFAKLYQKLDSTEFLELAIDPSELPEVLVQEEMFRLEEKLIGDKEAYFRDLVRAFRKELQKEELANLQEKLRAGGDNADELLKQIYELVKKGQTS
jgi:DNA primase